MTRILILAALLQALVAGAGWMHLRAVKADAAAQIEGLQSVLAAEREAAAVEHAQAVERARAEGDRRTAALQEIVDEATQTRDRAAADAAGARAALDRLRRAATAAAAATLAEACAGPADPAVAESGPPAAGTGLVLSDVLGSAGSRVVDLGAALDQSRAAGLACERAYEALTP